MQLGTEIGKMTRKLFTQFSRSRPWMFATGDRTETHQKSDRLRDDLASSLTRTRAQCVSITLRQHRKHESRHHVTGCNAARSRLRCWQRLARRTTGDQPGSALEIRSMPRLSWLARCRLRRQDHFNHLPVTLQVGSSDLVNHPEPIRLFRC